MNTPLPQTWGCEAELRLQQLEAKAGAARAAAQEIYQGELTPAMQSLQRVVARNEQLEAWQPTARPGQDFEQAKATVNNELASLQAQREHLTAAVAEVKTRRNKAQEAARIAGSFANRARTAYEKAAGTVTQFNSRDGFTRSPASVYGG